MNIHKKNIIQGVGEKLTSLKCRTGFPVPLGYRTLTEYSPSLRNNVCKISPSLKNYVCKISPSLRNNVCEISSRLDSGLVAQDVRAYLGIG